MNLKNNERETDLDSIKVSIIVAVYNIENYVAKCLDSIISQDYRNIEIIVVDDCSKDHSGQICDIYAQKDDRIKVIHHEKNLRQWAVRNNGMTYATGDYIVFVDGDDWLAPDFVSYMLSLVNSTDADMAVSYNNFTTRDKEQIQEDRVIIWTPEEATYALLYVKITIGAWNKIFRRSFLKDNGIKFDNLFTAEGYKFITDASQRANKVAVGHRKVYYYRLTNPNSATTKPDVRQGLGSLEALDLIRRDLIIKSPRIEFAILEHYFLNWEYTIRLIIETNSKKQFRTEFLECKHNVRKNGLKIAVREETIYRKLKAILYWMAPVTIAYLAIIKRRLAFRIDVSSNKSI